MMKVDHYAVVVILVSVTVKRLPAVTAEKSVSRVKYDKENSTVSHPEESLLFYGPLPLEEPDDKVDTTNLQRNSDVDASASETLPEGVASLREFPKSLLNEGEGPALPTVSKEGILYYDIAQAEEAEVVIARNSVGVEGVTATRGKGPCPVQSLVLEDGYVLDKDVAIHCDLKNLTMRGSTWLCAKDWSWLQNVGKAVNYKKAKCADIFCPSRLNNTVLLLCSFEEGLKKVVQYDIPMCPDVCSRCRWYLNTTIKVSYICSDANLTESTFPDFPENITSLSLERNKLRSTEMLFDHLKKYRKIEALYLNMNELDTFPYLDSDVFSNLQHIYLNDNQMKEFELEAIQTLLAKPDCVISLNRNPWRCGCNAYLFSQIMLKYYREKEPIQYMALLKCFDEANNEWIPMKFLSGDGCINEPFTVSYWMLFTVVSGFLNTIMIYLILDLSLILANFRGWKNTKRPKMDYVVCWLKAKLKKIKRAKGEEDNNRSSCEKEVTIRNHNTCRNSVYRRTPRPAMD